MIAKIAKLVFDKNEFKGQASIIYYKCGFQFRQNYVCRPTGLIGTHIYSKSPILLLILRALKLITMPTGNSNN